MHQDPYIPCIAQRSDKKHRLQPGQALAIEVMYAAGDARLVEAADGWTFTTADGSLTGYFEDTILINPDRQPPTIVTS